MGNVSIILTTRHSTGNNIVEVILECEKKYNALALCGCAADLINMAKDFGGELIPWTKMPEKEKFCHAFKFETEEMKKEFLQKLLKK